MAGALGRDTWKLLRCAVVALVAVVGVFSLGSAAQAQSWTVTKTASPTTYSHVGDLIHYTYAIQDIASGAPNQTITSIVDNKATVNCPSGFIVPALGPPLICNATYAITAADIAAGSVTNTVEVIGKSCVECDEDVTDNETVTYVPPPDWTLTKAPSPATYTAAGQSIAYSYVLTNTGSQSISAITLTDDKVSNVSCPATTLAVGAQMTCTGTYTTTDADLVAGSVTNTAIAHGVPASGTLADVSAQATITGQRQSIGIPPFLHDRIIAILHDEPDRPRFIRRMPGTLWGNPDQKPVVHAMYFNDPVDISANGNNSAGEVAIATSLQQLLAYSGTADRGGVAGASAVDPAVQDNPVDIWTEAHYAFGTSARNFRFASWYLGADYLVRPSVMLGVLSQVDWTKETLTNISATGEGTGWMVGPYASVHLAPNLYLDGRFAWGQSDNTIAGTGGTDEFSTDRFLARVNLTGNWQRGDWRVTPSAALAYLTENQHAYTDAGGAAVAAQSVAVGRLSAGPEVAKRFIMEDGTVVEPMASVMFDWDFAKSGQTSGASTAPDLAGSATLAVMATKPSGVSMRATAKYDGIGAADYQTFGLQFWLSVPLN